MSNNLTYKIILNPTSGRGRGGQRVQQIEALLNAYALNFEIVQTEYPWHAVELAQQAREEGYDIIIAAGGDGTVNEVLNGLIVEEDAGNHIPALGVLSIGRGNDFAYGMGIPIDLESGCQALANDQRK